MLVAILRSLNAQCTSRVPAPHQRRPESFYQSFYNEDFCPAVEAADQGTEEQEWELIENETKIGLKT